MDKLTAEEILLVRLEKAKSCPFNGNEKALDRAKRNIAQLEAWAAQVEIYLMQKIDERDDYVKKNVHRET